MASVGEVTDSRFNLFERRSRQVSVRETRLSQHAPTGSVANPQIEFVVSGTGEGYIDLANSYFTVQVGVVQDFTNLNPLDVPPWGKAKIVPVSSSCVGATLETNFAHLVFEDVRIYLNGVDCSDQLNQLYGFQAFYRDAIAKSAAYGAGGAVTAAAIDPSAYAVGESVLGGSGANMLNVRGTRVSMSAGGGQDTGLTLCRTRLNTDLPRSETTDENFCAYPYDFARGSKRRGLSAPISDYDYAGSNQDQPMLSFRFVPKIGIWEQTKLLPPNTDIRIVLRRASPALPMHRDVPPWLSPEGTGADGSSAIAYNEAESCAPIRFDWGAQCQVGKAGVPTVTFNLIRVYPTESMKEAVATALIQRPANYHILRARMQALTFSNKLAIDATGLFAGVRPELVMVAMTSSVALLGEEQAMSPYYTSSAIPAQPGHRLQNVLRGTAAPAIGEAYRINPIVQEMYVTWGARQIPIRPYSEATEAEAQRAYYEGYVMNAAGGEEGNGDGPLLSYADWKNNYTVWCFNLNPDEAPPGVLAPPLADVGSMELHVRFRPDATVGPGITGTIVTIGFSGAIVEIDAQRNVSRIGF